MPVITPHRIKSLTQIDPIFSDITVLYGAPPSWSREQGYETLCRIILEQQVSLHSAKATYEKLLEHAGIFTPAAILSISDIQMRELTVSRQKASYIKGLGQLIIDGDLVLSDLESMTSADAKEKLISVRGIGHWTAEVYLLFCLAATDIFPRGDVALNNTVKELKSVNSNDEVYLAAEAWSPYRSTAAYLLWHYYLCQRGREFVI